MYPLANSSRFVAMSALVALPFGRLGARPCWGPYRSTLWPIRADLLPFRPLSLYPLAVSAIFRGWGPVSLYRQAVPATFRGYTYTFRIRTAAKPLSFYPLADSDKFADASGLGA